MTTPAPAPHKYEALRRAGGALKAFSEFFFAVYLISIGVSAITVFLLFAGAQRPDNPFIFPAVFAGEILIIIFSGVMNFNLGMASERIAMELERNELMERTALACEQLVRSLVRKQP